MILLWRTILDLIVATVDNITTILSEYEWTAYLGFLSALPPAAGVKSSCADKFYRYNPVAGVLFARFFAGSHPRYLLWLLFNE